MMVRPLLRSGEPKGVEALDLLKSDHRRFLRALGAMEASFLDPQRGSSIGIGNAARFFRAELEAHMKAEEGMLYPTLAFHAPTRAIFSSLKAEHALVRRHLCSLERALAEEGRGEIGEPALRGGRAFVRSFVHHIFTEEHVLFPLVEKLVNGSEREEIGKAIWALERGELSADTLTPGD